MKTTYTGIARKLIYLQVTIVLYIRFLTSVLGFPTILKYSTDMITIVLLLLILLSKKSFSVLSKEKISLMIIFIFLLIVSLGALINFVPIHLFLWGIRNIFRFYIFYLACMIFLDKFQVNKIINLVLISFWINLIITIVQYYFFNIKGDYLGGIFGIEQGCNGITNLYICIVITYIYALYVNKKLNFIKLVIYSLAFFMYAALAELKVCYVEFVFIVLFTVIISKPSFKNLFLLIFSIIALVIGIKILSIYFPSSVKQLLDFSVSSNYLSEDWRGEISFTRMNTIQLVKEYFFKDNVFLNGFGYGLGACEVSSFFVSDFYIQYGYLNYRMYVTSTILLQTGFLGLAIYILFYIIQIFKTYKVKLKEYNYVKLWIKLIAANGIFLSIYGFATLEDTAYILFFAFAIPSVVEKNHILNDKK